MQAHFNLDANEAMARDISGRIAADAGNAVAVVAGHGRGGQRGVAVKRKVPAIGRLPRTVVIVIRQSCGGEQRGFIANGVAGRPTGDAVDGDAARSLDESALFVSGWRSVPHCSDGVDNDNDGATDHPADTDCLSPQHGSERPPGSCGLLGAEAVTLLILLRLGAELGRRRRREESR